MFEREHLHPPQEPDEVAWKVILVVAIAVIAASVVLSLWARCIVVDAQPPEGRPDMPPPPSGELEYELFRDDEPVEGQRDRDARLERLRSWGWIDRDRGVIHLPIEHAMELVAEQEADR